MGGGEPAGTVGPGRDAQYCRPAARAGRARYGGHQCGDLAPGAGVFDCDDLGTQTLKGMVAPAAAVSGAVERVGRRAGLTWRCARGPDAAGGPGGRSRRCCCERWAQAKTVWARWCCSVARRDWQIAPGAGAQRARGSTRRNAPEFPLFAVSPAERSVSGHRAPAAAGCGCTGTIPRGEARASWSSVLQALSLASGRDCAAISCPALAAASRALPAPTPESPERRSRQTQDALVAWLLAEAEQTARARYRGRPALG